MLEIGSIVDGKYRILRVIGQGGMGIVYLAINERANKLWAIKEICRAGLGCDVAVQRSFVTELEILRRLRNPHLPCIVDVIDRKDTFLIVMDYIEGEPLSLRLRGEMKGLCEDVIDYGIQLCEVLEYLHGQVPPVIYGDLKPSNIIVRPDGTLFLIDFGAAREFGICTDIEDISFGTAGYAAPEQYGERGIIDVRTDIFALGATLCHLYTGRLLQENTFKKAYGLDAVINRCVQRCPDNRYQCISDVKRDLELLKNLGEAGVRRQRDIFRVRSLCLGILIFLVLRWGGMMITAGMYEDYIQSARTNSADSAREEAYLDAIALDSSRIEAYIGLLEEYLSDDYYEYMASPNDAFGNKTESQKMEEQIALFSGSEYDRAELMYRLGIAMYYYADGVGNKAKSYRYFNIVVGEDEKEGIKQDFSGNSSKLKRAICLRNIAGYYERLYDYGRTGDENASFRQYWEDMTVIIQDNIAAEDNYKTALLVYKEFLTAVRDSIVCFRDSNITKEEVISQIEVISQHIEKDLPSVIDMVCRENPVLRENITTEIQSIKNISTQTVEQVNMAYGENEANI